MGERISTVFSKEFVRWSLEYDLWCKIEFFGADIEEAMNTITNREKKRHGRMNLLELLPDEFTFEDAIRVRRSQGMDAEGTRNMLWQWIYRNYITKLTIDNNGKGGTSTITGTFKKTIKWK